MNGMVLRKHKAPGDKTHQGLCWRERGADGPWVRNLRARPRSWGSSYHDPWTHKDPGVPAEAFGKFQPVTIELGDDLT